VRPGSIDSTSATDSAISTTIDTQPAVSRTLPGRAYDLAYDPDRNAIWYAVMELSIPPTFPLPRQSSNETLGPESPPVGLDTNLFEASASTGEIITAFSIPNPDRDKGLNDVVGIAPDHSVWVTESYNLYRIDPSTSAVQTIPLPKDVSGSVNTSIQGTFVTAMTFTNTSVLVARNNVPFLQQWSLDLQPLASVDLPAGDYGANFLTTTGSGIQMMTNSGSDASSVAGTQADIPLPPGTTSPTTSNGSQLQPQYLIVRPDRTTANVQSFDGAKILTVEGSPQTLAWQPSTCPALQIFWPTTTGEITNPLGKQVSTQSWPQLEASVILPNNMLWTISTAPGETPAKTSLQLYTSN